MRKHLLFFVLLLSIFYSACKIKCPPLTDSQKADIEKEILEQWDKMKISIEKADIVSITGFYSTDEFEAYLMRGEIISSREAYLDTLRVWFSNRKSNELQQKTVKEFNLFN